MNKYIFYFIAGILLLFPNAALATTTRNENPIRCEAFQKRVVALQDRINARQEKRDEFYSNFLQKIDRIIQTQAEKGKDVAVLKQDRQALADKTQEIKLAMDKYQSKLSDLGKLECSDWSREKLKLANSEIRSLGNTVKEKSQELRKFFRNVVKPHIWETRNK